jgi:putative ABC transport system ATP-binding protein
MIDAKNLRKEYHLDGLATVALADVSFTIKKGEFVAIMGASGSGKSTLMHILGALDLPTSGSYVLDGQNISNLVDSELASIRNQKIGFVFQSYNLLPRTPAIKNVMLPMVYANVPPAERVQRGKKLLELVGLHDRINHRSNQLSGGQQQRVAIARALALNPAIILADEPTGNLATAQAEEIMHIFRNLHREGRTIVMITHEPSVAAYAERVITLRDGRILSDRKQ